MIKRFATQFVAFLLACAVIFSAFLPFFATYSEKVAPSGLASIFGEKVLICTSEGFKWAKWEDLQSGKSPVKHHKNYSCPLCYLADGVGKLLLTAGVLLILREQIGQGKFLHLRTAYAYARPSRAIHPRAPPR
ncbi:MAG: hypothetical protein EBR02_04500 [Alphaproteobacteria bacterium]|nr:hypothetical protein [Alphaproteobacteria bacterium]